jgi:hypothetical protein
MTEKSLNRKQSVKQTRVQGAHDHVLFDPPEWFGFVSNPDVSKAKLVLTLMNKVCSRENYFQTFCYVDCCLEQVELVGH